MVVGEVIFVGEVDLHNLLLLAKMLCLKFVVVAAGNLSQRSKVVAVVVDLNWTKILLVLVVIAVVLPSVIYNLNNLVVAA